MVPISTVMAPPEWSKTKKAAHTGPTSRTTMVTSNQPMKSSPWTLTSCWVAWTITSIPSMRAVKTRINDPRMAV